MHTIYNQMGLDSAKVRSGVLPTLAEAYARGAHQGRGQVRKYTGEPYINHPARCAELARRVGLTDVEEAALWLHDVVEDTDVEASEIFQVFGAKVQSIVFGLTNVHERGFDGKYLHNRKTRHQNSMNFLASQSNEVKACRLIDSYDNLFDVHIHDPKFAETYVKEKRDVLRICGEANYYVANLLLERILIVERHIGVLK